MLPFWVNHSFNCGKITVSHSPHGFILLLIACDLAWLDLRSIVELWPYEKHLSLFLYPFDTSTILNPSSLYCNSHLFHLFIWLILTSFHYSWTRRVRYKLIKFMRLLAHNPGLQRDAWFMLSSRTIYTIAEWRCKSIKQRWKS